MSCSVHLIPWRGKSFFCSSNRQSLPGSTLGAPFGTKAGRKGLTINTYGLAIKLGIAGAHQCFPPRLLFICLGLDPCPRGSESNGIFETLSEKLIAFHSSEQGVVSSHKCFHFSGPCTRFHCHKFNGFPISGLQAFLETRVLKYGL